MLVVDIGAIVEVLATTENITAVWLFGSAQQGHVRPGGDIDIGILFAADPALDQLLDLEAALQTAAQLEAVDVIVLNHASPILRFEAISGRLLVCRDLVTRAAFVAQTAREYEYATAFWQWGLAQRSPRT